MQKVLEKRTVEKKPMPGEFPVLLSIPGINMFAEDGELVTEVLLPEFAQDEVGVTATSDGVEISAVHSSKASKDENKARLMREGRQSYWRHLSLPREARPEAMKQEFRNGKLRITMPVGAPLDAAEKEMIRRKEIDHGIREASSEAKGTKVLGYRDQEFPNHWTRYRPIR